MSTGSRERRAELEARLWAGDRHIQEAEAAGKAVPTWEALWLQLLHEYEAVCRELDGDHGGLDPGYVVASPSRSPAYLAALAALQDAELSYSEHDAPQTLLQALQPLIIAAATAESSAFDRARFDDLWRRWNNLNAEQDGDTMI